jgi:hypothetical protein
LASPVSPPWPWHRGAGLRGCAPCRATRFLETHRRSPRDLRFSFGDAFPVRAVCSFLLLLVGRSLPGSGGVRRRPLLGFPKIAPPPYEVMCVHSRSSFRGRSPFGTRSPVLVRGPPLPFLTTSTVCTAHHPAGLLHPATGHGVRRVSVCSSDLSCQRVATLCGSRLGSRPHATPYPSKLFPLQQLLPCHHSRCPLAVANGSRSSSCRVATTGWRSIPRQPDLRALFHCRVRCRVLALPPDRGPMLPWASSPGVCVSLRVPPGLRRMPLPGPPALPLRSRESASALRVGVGCWLLLACSRAPPRRGAFAGRRAAQRAA